MIFSKNKTVEAFEYLETLFEQEKDVRIEIFRKSRTLRQNRLYWLFIACIEQETGNDKEYLHIYFCKKFLPIIEKKIFNEIIYDRTSTTSLDTLGFKYFLDKIQGFASTELNITLPNPDDLHFKEFEEHYKNYL